ncbi:YdcF family protein [Streptomyces sp. E-08]|uniref:YdcF family protein n=1 Tax=Streptomyces sp. E-08 TaxID=3404047 RepID=UPI003CF90FB9
MRAWTLPAAGAALLVWGEWLNRRWSKTLVNADRDGSRAVVVLGYRNPSESINFVNRWRVRAGLRSVGTGAGPGTVVVFSGGPVGNDIAEARLMADHARSTLHYTGRVLVEDRSRNTWENITHVVPLIEDARQIVIVSQPAHALKARAYLRRQRPDLADRLVRADDYRLGEWTLLKPLLAAYGLWSLRGLTPAERRPSPAGRADGVGVRRR